MEMSTFLRLQGGRCFVGMIASGVVLTATTAGHDNSVNKASSRAVDSTNNNWWRLPEVKPQSIFGINLFRLSFLSSSMVSTNPIASSYTTTRHPETFTHIENELNQIKAWMNLKLKLSIPPIFSILFDSDAVGIYERLFSSLMKVIMLFCTL